MGFGAKAKNKFKGKFFKKTAKPRKEGGGVRSSRNFTSSTLTDEEIAAIPMNPEVGKMLEDVPFLARLTPTKRNKIGGAFEKKVYQDNEVLIKQGDSADDFFIISKGKAQITYEDENGAVHNVALLSNGDYCGETALVTRDPRNATVTAKGTLHVLMLSARVFRSLFTKDFMNVQFGHRDAVCDEINEFAVKEEQSDEPRKRDKSLGSIKLIKTALKNNILFRNTDDKHLDELISKMWQTKVKVEEEIISQGDQGDYLYVIENGKFNVHVEKFDSDEVKTSEKIDNLGPGTCFGELALMYDSPRAATIISETAGLLWTLDRGTFRRVMKKAALNQMKEYEEFLKKVPILAPLMRSERSQLCEALEERVFPDGSTIVSQGEKGDTFFIIKSGSCVVSRREDMDDPESKQLQTLMAGHYFGERALLTDESRAATVSASGEALCLMLRREAFDRLLGPLKSILERKAKAYESSPDEQGKREKTNYKFEELKTLGTLGIGAFGHVKLVQDPKSSQTYAMKSVSKTMVVNLNQQEHLCNERKILMDINGPFFINLYQTFNTADQIHFLLEVALGGELFTLLRNKTHFKESTARFYAGSVILAFDHLHKRNIIYRDLKPENLLLAKNGYLKLTDFGFAKVVPDRTFTLCGTPDYLAPEMVCGLPHNKGVDWWTLGILIFEMLACYPPFYGSDQMKTYKRIVRGKIKFPSHFSSEVIDLIKGLTNVKPTKRLGVTVGGAKAIMRHSWFKDFDWTALANETMKAPIIPKIEGNTDISNFDDFFEPKIEKYVDDGTDWAKDF